MPTPTTFAKERSYQARSVELRTAAGEVAGSIDLDPAIFGIEPNVAVMHQVVTAQLAAARSGTQSTKTRAEVAGGGRKPFKQKGTGRARQGSERAPQFTGGGVALGPKPRSYQQRTPRKMVALALRSALSDRASEGRVAVVDGWAIEQPSTKAAVAALAALELTGKVLVVLERTDEEALLSFRNLPTVHVLAAGELNTYDVLRNDWVVFTPATLPSSSAEAAPAETASAEAASAEAASAETAPAETASDEAASAETEDQA